MYSYHENSLILMYTRVQLLVESLYGYNDQFVDCEFEVSLFYLCQDSLSLLFSLLT